jgi:hypothetical protein
MSHIILGVRKVQKSHVLFEWPLHVHIQTHKRTQETLVEIHKMAKLLTQIINIFHNFGP